MMVKSLIVFLMFAMSAALEGTLPPTHIGVGRRSNIANDPYVVRIASYYQGRGQTVIVLDNGTVWRAVLPSLWLVGDTITFTPLSRGRWNIYDATAHSSATAEFEELQLATPLRITASRNEVGELFLSDGSSWKFGWWERIWGRLWEWRAGDRMVVVPLRFHLQGNTHLLINVDRSLRSATATFIPTGGDK